MPARDETDIHERRLKRAVRLLLVVPVLATVMSASPLLAQASKTPKPGPPKATTGNVTAVRGNSATLEGSVDPGDQATSYSFQYGPTIAYGKQTTAGKLPAGTAVVKVGQAVTGVASGYHYRLVAVNASATAFGKDRVFGTTKVPQSKLTVAKSTGPIGFGDDYVLSGALSGTGNAGRTLVLQASAFPFLEPFTSIGPVSHADAAGRFSFRVASLKESTQFRVSTLDPRPLYSAVVTQLVGVKVSLKVRSSSRGGLVRLYGTVTPAKPGAHVYLQLFRQVRPGSSEKRTSTYTTVFSTVVKRATANISRFSIVEQIRRGGAYRALVRLSNKSAVGSGSSKTVLLRGAPSNKPKH